MSGDKDREDGRAVAGPPERGGGHATPAGNASNTRLDTTPADRETILLRRRLFVASALAGISTVGCDKINPFQPCLSPVPVPPSDAAVAASSGSAGPVAQTTQPVLSRATQKIVGVATADVLLRSKTATLLRVNAKDFVQGDASAERFFGYQVQATGRALSERQLRELARLLLDDASYGPDEKAVCDNSECYGLRAQHAAETVALLFVFPCNRVAFLRRASRDGKLTPGEYFDPVASAIRRMLRGAF
ncbi:MAG TPA: hypothetical protein PKA88_12795 [Polyangiaceae bacterium]|nr:hypothetical protein [Polyangiaceae bacterium]